MVTWCDVWRRRNNEAASMMFFQVKCSTNMPLNLSCTSPAAAVDRNHWPTFRFVKQLSDIPANPEIMVAGITIYFTEQVLVMRDTPARGGQSK